MTVALFDGGVRRQFMAHVLIALAFLGPSLLTVNHKNEVKSDNRASNLEYMTIEDNIRYSSKLTMEQADCIREMYATGAWTHRSLGAYFNVAHANIYLILHDRRWSHANNPTS